MDCMKFELKASKQKMVFLNSHIPEIITTYQKRKYNRGLVEVWVNSDFKIGTMEFKEERFWKKRFALLPVMPERGKRIVGIEYIFGRIQWRSDHTTWFFQYPMLIYDSNEKDYLNILESISDN